MRVWRAWWRRPAKLTTILTLHCMLTSSRNWRLSRLRWALTPSSSPRNGKYNKSILCLVFEKLVACNKQWNSQKWGIDILISEYSGMWLRSTATADKSGNWLVEEGRWTPRENTSLTSATLSSPVEHCKRLRVAHLKHTYNLLQNSVARVS